VFEAPPRLKATRCDMNSASSGAQNLSDSLGMVSVHALSLSNPNPTLPHSCLCAVPRIYRRVSMIIQRNVYGGVMPRPDSLHRPVTFMHRCRCGAYGVREQFLPARGGTLSIACSLPPVAPAAPNARLLPPGESRSSSYMPRSSFCRPPQKSDRLPNRSYPR
jgi:hypothetical protein